MVQYGRSSRSSWAESVRSSFGRTVMGKAIWENPIENTVGRKFPNGNAYLYTVKNILISVCGWHQISWKKQNINPMWKVRNKEVDLGEPTAFLDHVYLGCTQRQCETSKDIVDNYRNMFETRISAGGTEKLTCSENLSISSRSYDMEGHAKKCVERYCELANKTTQQLYKVSTPSIDDHHFKEKELKSVGDLSNVCSQLVVKCLYLARIGRPKFYGQWSNLHDRSQNGPKHVTNDYLVWSLTFIAHVSINNIVMRETLQNHADWDSFKTPILQEIVRTQNLRQVEHCAFSEAIR